MSKIIFIDTGALIAMANKDEDYHEYVHDFFVENRKLKFYTTDYILDEFLTFMRCKEKEPVKKVVSFMTSIYASEIEIVSITKEIFLEALGILIKYEDHFFSFTDCVSFVVMKVLKIKDVITTDKHFMIAGFNNLLTK